ncbi:MAG TPA: Rid family detoxifying hydrolase [Candidatus Krumholzibacteria bacterium]|nr:Rid family detoxifying hydrolase [Candidatus Krumholzibacteria bacterium]
MKSPLHSVHAPQPIGPYTQAIRANDFVFLSGQIAIDPATGKLIGNDAAEQAAQVLKNIKAILTAAGLTFDEVVKSTIFLKNMDDFTKVNEVYGESFDKDPPARSMECPLS